MGNLNEHKCTERMQRAEMYEISKVSFILLGYLESWKIVKITRVTRDIYREGGGQQERDRAVNGFMTSCPSIIIIRFDDTVRALVSRVCRSHVLDYHQIAYLSICMYRDAGNSHNQDRG